MRCEAVSEKFVPEMGAIQGFAPDGAGFRHNQHPKREKQTLDAMARRREPLCGAVQLSEFNKGEGGDIWFALGEFPTTGLLRRHLDQLDVGP